MKKKFRRRSIRLPDYDYSKTGAYFITICSFNKKIIFGNIIDGKMPSKGSYRTREEMLEIFDKPDSQARLADMIDNYDPKKEGIMTLITSYSNATFFVTCRL